MKKSNKFLFTAILILIISLGVYNAALKAEYRKGTYNDPYQNFTALSFKNFNEVALNAGSVINVKIERGNYRVRVHNNVSEFLKIRQEGNRLIVDVIYPGERKRIWANNHVIIACPDLQSLQTNTVYKANGKIITDKKVNQHEITIEGLAQEKLNLNLDNASRVLMAHNRIHTLEAIAGKSSGSFSGLNLAPDNQVKAANLDIRSQSQLVFDNLVIPDLTYTFSDSAQLDMKGSALQLLKR